MNLGRLAVAATVVGLAFVADASSSKTFATSNLDLRATLLTDSLEVRCPAEAPPHAICRARSGTSRIRGLGNVSSSYTWFAAAATAPRLS